MNTRRPTAAAGESWRKWSDEQPGAVVLVEDQERPLIWIDPVHVDEDELWDPQAAAWVPRPPGSCALLVGLAAGAIVGIVLGLVIASAAHAASRPAQTTTPLPGTSELGDRQAHALSPTAADGRRVTASTSAGPTPAPDAPRTSGVASWYGATGLIAAAGPELRVGHWRGELVTVAAGGRSVRVRLADWCACPARLIDLSDDAFRHLAPLSVGLLRVTVTPAGPVATPPPTDVEP